MVQWLGLCASTVRGGSLIPGWGLQIPRALSSVAGVREREEMEVALSLLGPPGGSDGKESACNAADLGSIPGSGRSPGEVLVTSVSRSSVLARRIPWTAGLGGYSSCWLPSGRMVGR